MSYSCHKVMRLEGVIVSGAIKGVLMGVCDLSFFPELDR